MRTSLENENRVNPAKRPIWQGCGCLILVLFFSVMLSISFYGVYMRSKNPEKYKIDIDPRLELLDTDINKLSRLVKRDTDSLTFDLKECVAYDIVDGLDTDKFEYFTRVDSTKLLILIKVKDIKNIKVKYRYELIDVIEDCLYTMPSTAEINEVYIGVKGKWNMVLAKTPTESDLGGRFADKNLLLPFYGEKDTIPVTGSSKDTLLLD